MRPELAGFFVLALFALAVDGGAGWQRASVPDLTLAHQEFIYESAPFPSAHASTIEETPAGLVAAWFGGTAEKDPDVGIWVSRHRGDTWTTPVEVANGKVSDTERHPTWNPVLFQPDGGPLLLFYKVGPSPSEWWGLVMASDDYGATWSSPARLPQGILGPIRAKPVALPNGEFLAGSSTEDDGWIVHIERFRAPETGRDAAAWVKWLSLSKAWTRSGPLNTAGQYGAIQPTILVHSPERIQILCRSQQDVITEAWSEDGGRTWSPMRATSLPNPSAGIDSVRLRDGRFLLVYNPSTIDRKKLALATSTDGRTWSAPFIVEEGPREYSYPAMIVGSDGLVHLTYTWRRERIRHVVMRVN
jgi:predicted neuraminidase